MSDKNSFLYEFIKLLLIKVSLQATESLEKTFFTAGYGHLHIHHRIFFHLKKQGKVKSFVLIILLKRWIIIDLPIRKLV